MKRSARYLLPALLGAATLLGAVSVSASAEASPAVTSTAPEKEIDCVYVGFDSNVNMFKYGFSVPADNYWGGSVTAVSKGDADAPYIKFNYDSSISPYSPYRAFLKINDKKALTEDYKYVRLTYKTSDALAATFNFINTATEQKIALVENTSESKGKFVTAKPVSLTAHDMLKRLISSGLPMEYTGSWKDADFCIKEMVFFKTLEDAYAYYGEEAPKTANVTSLTFGDLGNGKTYDGQASNGASYGVHSYNEQTESLDVTYCELTNAKGIHYMAKIKGKATFFPADTKYMRLEYSAKHPSGVETATATIWSDGNSAGSKTLLVDNITNTSGFVLGPTVEVNELIAARFNANGHCSIVFDTPSEGGVYSIKALHFFSSKEDADAYTNEPVVTPDHTIKINGNDLKNYKLVIAEDAPAIVDLSTRALNKRIEALTGYTLPIITDAEPEGKYEILIGQSSREKSYEYLRTVAPNPEDYYTYAASLEGNTLSITSVTGYGMEQAIDMFMRSYLYVGLEDIPETIEINEIKDFVALSSGFARYNIFPLYDNIDSPTVFTEDFDTDEGYFTEESGEDNWKYEGGKYTSKASGSTLSYVHVWEADVTAEATMSYDNAGADGQFGLLLRYTDEGAYAKAGYDFKKGVWFIDYREGLDFFRTRAASVKATVTPGTDYKLTFTLDGHNATLAVNGETVLETTMLHVTPGQIGVFTKDVAAKADGYSAILLSGQGTVMKNTVHIKLPDDVYREGGSVVELNDGTWVYQHHKPACFTSKDNGLTWQKADKPYFPVFGYQQILRLNDGKLMQIGTATIDGVKTIVSFTSSDDGKTWVQGGSLVALKHPEFGINGGNMNDKLTQSPTTNRIFYSVCYEGSATVNGIKLGVFCEYYYSDDNGATWTRSEDASYDIMGDTPIERFGEHKILQCADGTLRMYCSWHTEGGIIYSESTDNGVTWGPIQKLDGFKSSHASMQFQHDPYGPTTTTYYMVWINAETPAYDKNVPNRTRLSLARTTDGKNWEFLGDIWHWESGYRDQVDSTAINHIVDPFIVVMEDYVVCGTGISERRAGGHHEQRQNIWSIRKDTLPEGKKVNAFTDMDLGAPYYNAVNYVTGQGLFNGTSATTFSPASPMTRAMFVTVLGRLAKADTAAYATPTFNDVAAGQWYTSYVEWAAANGIVNGLGNGIYGINDNVTVQQACVILARYADYKAAADGTGKTLADYADSAEVASWAAKEVEWAVANGIYTGVGTSLNPTAPASRALVATMFANYVKAVK